MVFGKVYHLERPAILKHTKRLSIIMALSGLLFVIASLLMCTLIQALFYTY